MGGHKREVHFAAEELTKVRTYTNSTNIEISEHPIPIQGKDRIILNYNAQSNDALSILLDIFDDGNNINTIFK